jgi:hypothetical protein
MNTTPRKLDILWPKEVEFAFPVRSASAVVALAGSLLYRGLAIREALRRSDGPPTASRRNSRLAICATSARRPAAVVAQAGSLPYRGLAIRDLRRIRLAAGNRLHCHSQIT